MQKFQLHRIATAIILIFFCTDSFAQKRTFTEIDLSDKSKKNPPPQQSDLKILKNSTLLDQNGVESEIASILLGNKLESLMFDDEENAKIDRAIESFKNNEIYVPEGQEAATDKVLTEEEKKKEEEAKKKKVEENEENEKSYIYLASIIYFTPKDWAVWINRQKFTPEVNTKDKELYIKSVHKDRVKVVWKLGLSKWKILSNAKTDSPLPKVNEDNQVEIEFELQQNQTFVLKSNSVVEGKIMTLKKQEALESIKSTLGGLKTKLSPR